MTFEITNLFLFQDLDQDNSFVRSTLLSWITNLVQNYSIDGLRVDTVAEVNRDFWVCKYVYRVVHEKRVILNGINMGDIICNHTVGFQIWSKLFYCRITCGYCGRSKS